MIGDGDRRAAGSTLLSRDPDGCGGGSGLQQARGGHRVSVAQLTRCGQPIFGLRAQFTAPAAKVSQLLGSPLS